MVYFIDVNYFYMFYMKMVIIGLLMEFKKIWWNGK